MEFLADKAPMIGLLFFFLVFVGISVWVFRKGSGQQYREYAHIPLKEDSDEHA